MPPIASDCLLIADEARARACAQVGALRAIAPHANISGLLAVLCTPAEIALLHDGASTDLLSLVEARGGRLAEAEGRALFSQVAAGLIDCT